MQRALLEMTGRLAPQELRALLAIQARLEPRVLLEQMELQDRLARQESLALMGQLVAREQRG